MRGYAEDMSGSATGTIGYRAVSGSRLLRGYPAFAWSVLIYNLAVILWGALVRATGSGAGCGGHWPLCNGDILPASPQTATIIEFTHRVMSGVALIAAATLAAWSWKAYPARHPARRWAIWSLVFMLTEALIGAALVLLGHVAANESVGRVYSLAAHLLNTFLLLASLALTARWSTRRAPDPVVKEGTDSSVPAHKVLTSAALSAGDRAVGPLFRNGGVPLAIGMGALVLVAMAGVITALGDTLFPAHTLAQGIAEDFAATASFLVRLRVIHPVLGIAAGLFLVLVVMPQFRAPRSASEGFPPLKTLSGLLLLLVAAQILLGAATVLLKAPVAMQLAHLLVADALWITLVLYTSERLGAPR
jgi:heme a synthase